METHSSLVVPILIRIALNAIVAWALNIYAPDYFIYSGGIPGYILIGILLTIMNLIVRPILNVVIFPLRILAASVAIIEVNAFFVYLVVELIARMDPTLVALQIGGGITGWLIVSTALGLSNWVMRFIVK